MLGAIAPLLVLGFKGRSLGVNGFEAIYIQGAVVGGGVSMLRFISVLRGLVFLCHRCKCFEH